MTRTRTGEHAPRATLWSNRDFLKFWFGETTSLFGAQITVLALPLLAVTQFQAGPRELGLLGFVTWFSYVVFALPFGVWVDRSRRRPMMIGANLARLLLIGAIPVLSVVDRLDLVSLVLIASGVAVASVLFDVSWMSYVPTLVQGPKNLVEANGKLGATSAAAMSAGPGLGGLLVTALTAPVAMILDAVSYAVSVVTLLWIRVSEPEPEPPAGPRRLLAELTDGLRFVAGNRHLRTIALIGGLCNVLTVASSTLFLLYALVDKGLSPVLIGLVLAIGAIGGVVGATFSQRVVTALGVGMTYSVSMSVTFVGLVLIPIASGPRLLVVAAFVLAFFLAYLGNSVANVVIMSLRQTVTPHSLLGRMNAAMRTLMYAGAALGAAGAGVLGEVFGLRVALWLVAAGASVMIAAVIWSPVGTLREMPVTAE